MDNTNEKKPVSEARSEAARINGAKSKGPVTPEGKERSSKNATFHGVLSRTGLIPEEDRPEFSTGFQCYLYRHDPRDRHEYDLIEEAYSTTWRRRKAEVLHDISVAIQVTEDMSDVDVCYPGLDHLGRESLAYRHSLAQSNLLPNLERYIRQLGSQAARALKEFRMLRNDSLPPGQPHPGVIGPHPGPPGQRDYVPLLTYPPVVPPAEQQDPEKEARVAAWMQIFARRFKLDAGTATPKAAEPNEPRPPAPAPQPPEPQPEPSPKVMTATAGSAPELAPEIDQTNPAAPQTTPQAPASATSGRIPPPSLGMRGPTVPARPGTPQPAGRHPGRDPGW